MRSDSEDFDLYPPDAEDQPPEACQARMRAAVGAALLVWGMGLLVDRAVAVDIDTGMLGIGVGALAGWAQLRRYSWFVVGAILTGFGAGGIFEAFFGNAFGESLSSMTAAAGFAAIFVRYPHRSRWALIPAAFLAVFALGAFGVGLIGLAPDGLGRLLLPLLLITGGSMLLFRQSLPRNAVRVGVPAVAAAFVIVSAANVPAVGNLSFGGQEQHVVAELPPIEGKILVLDGGSGDVTLGTGEAKVEATVSRFGRASETPRLAVEENGDEVVVDLDWSRPPGIGLRSIDYRVLVPPGTAMRIDSESGDVTGRVRGGDVNIDTASGDVDLRLAAVEAGSTVRVETGSGDVEVESEEELTLDLDTGSGDIEVNGDEKDEDEPYEHDGEGPTVHVRTGSGEIEVDHAA